MKKLFTLLGLQRQAQEAATLDTLSHIVANDTHKLVPYKQAVFWLADGRRVSLHSASGNALLDEKGPYAVALKNIIHSQAFTQDPAKSSVQNFTPDFLKRADTSLPSAHALLVPFITQKDGVTGGLWLERDIPFEKAEQQLLRELSFGYAYALAMLKLRRHDWLSNLRGRHAGRLTVIVAAGLMMCLFIPVRLSVTAPAEIVAQNPRIIAAPFEGLMEQILVQPGDTVEPNQPVARMDTIALQARLDMTAQGQEISRAALARLRRESLTSPEKKTELKKLEAEIVAQQIEYDYARQKELAETHNQLALAEIELKSLLSLPLDAPVLLESKMENFAREYSSLLKSDIRDLEWEALKNRPEMQEEILKKNIAWRSTREEIIRTVPGLELFLGGNYDSNHFLENRNWGNYSARIMQSITALLTAPSRYEKAKNEEFLADARRQALALAIMAQTRIARHRLGFLEQQYDMAREGEAASRQQVRAAQEQRQTGFMAGSGVIAAQIENQIRVLETETAQADLQDAYAAFANTLGRNIGPASIQDQGKRS